MTASIEIGGFLPLDLPRGSPLHQGAISFNTARNALCWLLSHLTLTNSNVRRLWLPVFNCPEVVDAITARFPKIEILFYNINTKLEPICSISPSDEEVFYYYNIFGLKSAFACSLPPETIVDNVHAFYNPPAQKHHSLYSARKFFGVPDGAYLYSTLDLGAPPPSDAVGSRCLFLLECHDVGARQTYSKFLESEDMLSKAPITGMSVLAARLLCALDYQKIQIQRLENFIRLHEVLGNLNVLNEAINQALSDQKFVPFTYPWLHRDGPRLRTGLIERGVFVPTLWPRIASSANATLFEKQLGTDLVHLPVDQRYGPTELDYMLAQIEGLLA